MSKRIYMLMGPLTGHAVVVSDADAATSVTDGWGRDLSVLSEPFDSSGTLPMAKWPASLRSFLAQAGGGPLPDSITVPVQKVSKANPTVITVGTANIGMFNNGDVVDFAGTTTTLDPAAPLVVANKNAGAGTFTVAVDLSTLPADVTGKGTVTKI